MVCSRPWARNLKRTIEVISKAMFKSCIFIASLKSPCHILHFLCFFPLSSLCHNFLFFFGGEGEYFKCYVLLPATRLANVVFPVPGLPANTRWRGVSSRTFLPSRFLLSFCNWARVNLRNWPFRLVRPMKLFMAFSMRCSTDSCCTRQEIRHEQR